jgi:L-lactate dehydrogenase complex protein LldE
LRCGLVITCLADQFYPETVMAAVRVLQHYGVQVAVPLPQTCCGQPVYNNGLWKAARRIARRMIEQFEPYPYVVLPSGSCTAMIREHYEPLFEDDPAWLPRAVALAAKTYELIEFLRDIVGVTRWPALGGPAIDPAGTHYPCHLRGLGIKPDDNRRPLAEGAHASVEPLAREDQCCGFGGAFSFQFPELSGALLDDKLRAIQEAGLRTVVVNDAGCRMHLAGGAHRRGLDVRFVHLVELLAEGLGAPT